MTTPKTAPKRNTCSLLLQVSALHLPFLPLMDLKEVDWEDDSSDRVDLEETEPREDVSDAFEASKLSAIFHANWMTAVELCTTFILNTSCDLPNKVMYIETIASLNRILHRN